MKKLFCRMLVCGVLLAGCASTHPYSGYLEMPALLQKGKYFKQEYVAEGAHFSKYRKVYVEETILDYLGNRQEHKDEDLENLKVRFKEEFEKKLGEGYVLASRGEATDASTLVIRPALVYLATPNRALNVVTTAVVWLPVTSGKAAFEAKILDGATGLVLAEIAEKQTSGKDMKSLAVGAYTKYDHAFAAFKEWGTQLLEMLQSPEYR